MECVGAPVFGPDGTVMGAIPAFISQQRIMTRWDEESVKRPPCFQGFWDI